VSHFGVGGKKLRRQLKPLPTLMKEKKATLSEYQPKKMTIRNMSAPFWCRNEKAAQAVQTTPHMYKETECATLIPSTSQRKRKPFRYCKNPLPADKGARSERSSRVPEGEQKPRKFTRFTKKGFFSQEVRLLAFS
jgi:hypothetical protein